MINIGILGAAKIAPKGIIWPANDRKDCTIFAVASRSLTRAQDFAKEHNIPHALSDYEALIAHPDIHLIYNALPPNRHADLTIAAIKAGKSVLCEKPFAMNASQAEAMVAAANESKANLIEAFHYRFHPALLKFLDIIHCGEIGAVQSMAGRFNVSIPNRPGQLRYVPELGGGALMDLGCYTLHLSRLISKTNPTVKSAQAIKSDSGVDVYLHAEMDFDGIQSLLTCDMRENTEREITFEVVGEKGTILMDQYVHPYRDRGFTTTLTTASGTVTFTKKDKDADHYRSTYAYQLDHVMNVLQGNAEPLTGGQDALETMQCIDALYAAAGFERDL